MQASGATFSYYIDLRKIISQPQIFHQVVTAYATLIQPRQFDRVAGIPYGSLPIATGLALHLHHPMIYPRKEVKAHSTRRLVEGHFQPGETIHPITFGLIPIVWSLPDFIWLMGSMPRSCRRIKGGSGVSS
ncbi:hypothetical protein [Trichothermofontia sp.]